MCGSCAMTVNGVPRWTCRTHVDKVASDGRLSVAPLRNLPVIRDLAVDMSGFFDKWASARGHFKGARSRRDDFQRVAPGSTERRRADAAIECIGCAVCYAACDVVAANPDYLGPAALNRAWTLVNDVRDASQAERLRAVAGDAGSLACHTHMSCTERCPKAISPTAGIAGLKRAAGARRAEGRAVSRRAETLLWVAQRASAAVLALCVLVHLATIIYAVRGGLTARGDPRAHAGQRRLGRVLLACSCSRSPCTRRSGCARCLPSGSAGAAPRATRRWRHSRSRSRRWARAPCWGSLDESARPPASGRSRAPALGGRARVVPAGSFLGWLSARAAARRLPRVDRAAGGEVRRVGPGHAARAHLAGGLRVLALEFLPWRGWAKTLAALAAAFAFAVGAGIRARAVECA